MTRLDHGLVRREPRRLQVKQWQSPHGQGILQRLLGALRMYPPGPFSAARATLEAVKGAGPWVTGPMMRELPQRLHKQLDELVPSLGEADEIGENGCGLPLIASMAKAWGVSAGGGTKWCSLAFPETSRRAQ
ncbi:hypothetical protein ABZ714_00210 [Streptomyces sp. NPDC006798]|uniref:hypothetical protein n=1 Tax=Streptomyces sp. NPDC006798 TaxID=3155462 RepID=UPI0033F73490